MNSNGNGSLGNGSSGRPTNGSAANGAANDQYGYPANRPPFNVPTNPQAPNYQTNRQSRRSVGRPADARPPRSPVGLSSNPSSENSSSRNLVNTSASGEYYNPASERFNIQQELDRIEEIVLESPRFPLTGKTMVSEDELLDQLDVVRVNLPAAVQESVQIVQEREEILGEAEQYAQEIVTAAEKQAATILNEMSLIRQAEAQANQLRTQTEQECDALRVRTLSEVEQLQNQARQEWEEMRSRTVNEAKTIQEDADTYADQVLGNMEQQFMEMLHILRNGRQQIQGGQALDVESSAPQAQINPATGAARPVSRREARPSQGQPSPQPRPNQRP